MFSDDSKKNSESRNIALSKRDLNGLIMGFPLDHLLNQEATIHKPYNRNPGIKLPTQDDPGIGNIIICGPPGSGKSTLGLQIAAACAKIEENYSVSAFISLESTIDEIKTKARDYGWMIRIDDDNKNIGEDLLLEAMHLGDVDEFSAPDDHAENLLYVLTRPDNCPAVLGHQTADCKHKHQNTVSPHILLPMFTPREIDKEEEASDTVFYRRYQQLEKLLLAAHKLEEKRTPKVALLHMAEMLLAMIRYPFKKPEKCKIMKEIVSHIKAQAIRIWDMTSEDISRMEKAAAMALVTISAEEMVARVKEAISAARVLALKSNDQLMSQLPKWALSALVATKHVEIKNNAGYSFDKRLIKYLERSVQKIRFSVGARSILPIVVIDSLNMFGSSPLDRNQIHQLFGLFKRYKRIGVFTVETGEESLFDSTIADVVIKLSATKDAGYAVRYIEIEKSRYSKNVRGLHPFKTISFENQVTPCLPGRNYPLPNGKNKEPARCGVVIFPSLHHIVLKTDVSQNQVKDDDRNKLHVEPFHECFGIGGFDTVLPQSLMRAKKVFLNREGQEFNNYYLRGRAVIIEGEKRAFKTSIALNFLASGLIKHETTMLIRLSDTPLFEEHRGTDKSTDSAEQKKRLICSEKLLSSDFKWNSLKLADDSSDWQNIAPMGKVQIRKLYWENPKERGKRSYIFELDFKGGHVLPEEFVQFISDVLIRCDDPEKPDNKIMRVVLDDVSQIGISYPFLRKSLTSGTIFLPTFVHIMRNFGISLVMVGSKSGVPEADEIVTRAGTLSDAIISCRFVDVFGKRCVAISGGVKTDMEQGSVLPVIWQHKTPNMEKYFKLDSEYLEGLVGVETANVHRPGLILHVFEEDVTIQHAYNLEMKAMLRAGLARPGFISEDSFGEGLIGTRVEAADVSIQPFNARLSESIHDSLSLLGEKPFDRTVLCTIDEFSGRSPETAGLFIMHDLDRQKNENGRKELPKTSKLYEVARCISNIESMMQNTHNRLTDDAQRRVKDILNELNMDILPSNKKIKELEEFSKGSNSIASICHELNGLCHLRYVWPYYCNTLLIAYNTDRLKNLEKNSESPHGWPAWNSWENVWGSVKTLLSNQQGLAGRYPFWFDLTASETLSCLLLDTLLVCKKALPWNKRHYHINKVLSKAQWMHSAESEIRALQELLRMGYLDAIAEAKCMLSKNSSDISSTTTHLNDGSNNDDALKIRSIADIRQDAISCVHSSKMVLPRNADVYVCWYSQLRELIEREPQLAKKMRVCPLPGKGFRGDWYIGILKGSVSADLGREVIKKLCRHEEEYKRFSRSIGLPVSEKYRAAKTGSFYAWQHAKDVPLEEIYAIHSDAWCRSDIKNYTKIRSTLSNLAWQLISQTKKEQLDAKKILGKLINQIQIVND